MEIDSMSFQRVLIANRGEIAVRIARTLHAMGLSPCAVYSDADRGSPHVALCDRAVALGGAEARESYLDAGRLLDAARRMDCEAVHPGYGFLSENSEFAAACIDAGLVFIGPPPEAISAMGDKGQARLIARRAGVSPVPGYDGPGDDFSLTEAAAGLGFPLLVKAKMGGGGKGMRAVASEAGLAEAIAAARREALNAFGDPSLLLERLVFPARHIEAQILADAHGQVAFLFERECSLQRRHQKVIEETPSVAVTPAIRARLKDAAISLASAVDYRGAGTIEFLQEEDGRLWFLEMNTRLQVEHGITEMLIGEDLVEWQVRIARGERLDRSILDPQPRGHAIEARVYAEDPASGFLPSPGRIHALEIPAAPGVRVDCGIEAGREVSPYYDPMLMKVMASGRDREQARRRLRAALESLQVMGPATNHAWLSDILDSPTFIEGRTYTHTLLESDPGDVPAPPPEAVLLAVSGLGRPAAGGLRRDSGARDPASPGAFESEAGFRIGRAAPP